MTLHGLISYNTINIYKQYISKIIMMNRGSLKEKECLINYLGGSLKETRGVFISPKQNFSRKIVKETRGVF
jgi:hypothetical protein